MTLTQESYLATYATPNATEMWEYRDFVQVGQGSDDKLAFQTLVKITGSVTNPQPTSEEEDYAYDQTEGRFISEDLSKNGLNCFSYCDNEPISSIDFTGNSAMDTSLQAFLVGLISGFMESLGEDVVNGTFDLTGSAVSALKGAGLSFLLASIFKSYFGTAGLGAQIPLRMGYAQGLLATGVISFGAGVAYAALAALGTEAGAIECELFEDDDPDLADQLGLTALSHD